MKKGKFLTAFSSIITAFVITVSAAQRIEAAVSVEVSADGRETVIKYEEGNEVQTPYLNDSGFGKQLIKFKNWYCIKVKLDDVSELPEGIYIYENELMGIKSPDADGYYYLYYKLSPHGYDMSYEKAMEIIDKLKSTGKISEIHLYNRYHSQKCCLTGNYLIPADCGYQYNEADFAELTEKGYTVSLRGGIIPGSSVPMSIVPAGFENLDEDERLPAIYRTMLDVYSMQMPPGVWFSPPVQTVSISCSQNFENMNPHGDANFDFSVDLYDAIRIAEYIIGKAVFPDNEETAADFNEDGKTDIYDAIGIAKYVISNYCYTN